MVNSVILVGLVDSDPELRATSAGRSNLRFRVQTWNQWKDRTYTASVTVVLWGDDAEERQREFKRGTLVAVEGRIGNRSYDSGGETKWVTEVTATRAQLVSAHDAGASHSSRSPIDDLPF